MTAVPIESSVTRHRAPSAIGKVPTPVPSRTESVTIVLPAFNEAQNLGPLMARIDDVVQRHRLAARIIVVDDGSTDGTADVAIAANVETPVQVLRHDRNAGLGRAVQTGLSAAVGYGGVIVTMDADDSHDPALIPSMLERIADGNDLIIASRFQPGGRSVGLPIFRRALSATASKLLRNVVPVRGARDYTSGFRAYRAELVNQLAAEFGEDGFVDEHSFACMLELLIKANGARARVNEVPLVLRYDRKGGRSKMNLFATLAGYRRVVQADRARRATTGSQGIAHWDARRWLNVTVAGLGLLLATPLMLLIALAIKLTSRGPVFYVQTRVGQDRRDPAVGENNHRRHVDLTGKPFTIYKFRTMSAHTGESEKQVWAQPDDPRVTTVGRFLRKTRLDEIPQLLNVLRGDMNIVGPRPEQPNIVLKLTELVDHYPKRHQVLPGITGWAQINQHYDGDLDDVRRKVELDLEYIHRHSAAEDLRIMLRTVPVMLFQRGAW